MVTCLAPTPDQVVVCLGDRFERNRRDGINRAGGYELFWGAGHRFAPPIESVSLRVRGSRLRTVLWYQCIDSLIATSSATRKIEDREGGFRSVSKQPSSE